MQGQRDVDGGRRAVHVGAQRGQFTTCVVEGRGATWTWADWKFTVSFGCPTFLSFGRNYEGARDAFVYVYSHDNDSAYEPADRMVMARVPATRWANGSAYEFLRGFDKERRPLWSKDIADRQGVFVHRGNCYRSGISYNAALKRYLWCQTLPKGDGGSRGDLASMTARNLGGRGPRSISPSAGMLAPARHRVFRLSGSVWTGARSGWSFRGTIISRRKGRLTVGT